MPTKLTPEELAALRAIANEPCSDSSQVFLAAGELKELLAHVEALDAEAASLRSCLRELADASHPSDDFSPGECEEFQKIQARADALLSGAADPMREELSRLRAMVNPKCTCDKCLDADAARKEAGR